MHVPSPDLGRSTLARLPCNAAMSMSSRSPTPDLTFVTGNSLEQLRDNANKTVRSHVARVSWSNQQKSDPKSRRRRRPLQELALHDARIQEAGPLASAPGQLALPLVDTQLDAARQIDPFRTYPAHWQAFFPRLVDHCECQWTCPGTA